MGGIALAAQNDDSSVTEYDLYGEAGEDEWLRNKMGMTEEEYKKFMGEDKMENQTFKDYDKRGVRPFVRYSTSSGGWSIECYRKKRKDESEGDHDWKMIREGNIQSYESREIAEQKAIELAEKICAENGF